MSDLPLISLTWKAPSMSSPTVSEFRLVEGSVQQRYVPDGEWKWVGVPRSHEQAALFNAIRYVLANFWHPDYPEPLTFDMEIA